MCQVVHSSVAQNSTRYLNELSRYNYVTPTSYLELLGLFNKIIVTKKKELRTARDRTNTGLNKVGFSFVQAWIGCLTYPGYDNLISLISTLRRMVLNGKSNRFPDSYQSHCVDSSQ